MSASALLGVLEEATELRDMPPPHDMAIVGRVLLPGLKAFLEAFGQAVKSWLAIPDLRTLGALLTINVGTTAAAHRAAEDRKHDLPALGLPSTGVLSAPYTAAHAPPALGWQWPHGPFTAYDKRRQRGGGDKYNIRFVVPNLCSE